MSFNLRNIREISNDPFAKFGIRLGKELEKFLNKQQTDKLENKEDLYSNGQDIDTVLRLHSLTSTNFFDFDIEYYSASEPDFDKLKLWLRGRNMGNDVQDISGFNNDGTIFGDPVLIDGTPFDYGIHDGDVKSLALKFNRPTSDLENEEYISIPDASNLQVSGISTGVSYFIRFRLGSLASQGGQDRTLFCKIDDSTPNNASMAQVTSTGRIQFFIKRAGTTYPVQTATSTVTTNTVYEVWLTYANSGNVQHIYVNNVDKSLTAPSAPTWPTGTDRNLSIMRKHSTTDGYVYGDFWDMELFREKVVSSTEVGRHYTNKLTLANIPFGQVIVSNYFSTLATESPPSPPGTSFTSASFTSTSFTTA